MINLLFLPDEDHFQPFQSHEMTQAILTYTRVVIGNFFIDLYDILNDTNKLGKKEEQEFNGAMGQVNLNKE